jgi:hypothetical protein
VKGQELLAHGALENRVLVEVCRSLLDQGHKPVVFLGIHNHNGDVAVFLFEGRARVGPLLLICDERSADRAVRSDVNVGEETTWFGKAWVWHGGYDLRRKRPRSWLTTVQTSRTFTPDTALSFAMCGANKTNTSSVKKNGRKRNSKSLSDGGGVGVSFTGVKRVYDRKVLPSQGDRSR